MKITTLIENTTCDPIILSEHGLSQYIETDKHKIMFDTGASDGFRKNAETLGIDISRTDTLILRHGNNDHTGGVMEFARSCPDADIYIHKYADGEHWNAERYIGIDRDMLSLPHLHILDGDTRIDEELFVFGDIKGDKLLPPGNRTIFKYVDGEKINDDFLHEQNLVVTENGKNVLFAGCAHRGIVNILDRYREIFSSDPDYVLGGFHLMKHTSPYTDEEIRLIKETAEILSGYNTIFYTGHCTSQRAFDIMSEIMGDKLHALTSGGVIMF